MTTHMTTIREKKYKDIDGVEICNDMLSVHVLPSSGGKIQSIRFSGKEYLAQNPGEKFIRAEYGAGYTEGDFSGFDDMFPTINACVYPGGVWDGIRLPDHGEVWTLPFEAEARGEYLRMSAYGVRLPYRFGKRISLKGARLVIDYRAENLTPFPMKHLWAAHPIFVLEEGTKLRLPFAKSIMNAYGGQKYLGEFGKIHPWPVSADGRDMSALSPKERCCNKYYVWNALKRNESVIEYPGGDSIALSCDAKKAPYLGLWVDERGFGDETMACVVPEPCTGAFDSITLADAFGKVALLPPKGVLSWQLRVTFDRGG